MNPANNPFEQVMRHRDTWRGRTSDFSAMTGSANSERHHPAGLPTGYTGLDAALVHEGWPPGTCIEVLSDSCGMGAMGLFLPAMETLTAQGRWQAFIAPPFTPYAPLLKARGVDTGQVLLIHPTSREQQLRSIEKALRSTHCSAVFSWLGAADYPCDELRRLERAAADSDTLAVLFRATSAAYSPSPAGLRLQISDYRKVRILQQLGGSQWGDICLSADDDMPQQPQLWDLPAAL
ncbi:translesion DNA synthesis-associated protein ImuA [Parahaliea aestuarii]|uniref:Translesion DNA synthesis-associated protein ImuA n=1 Tax=Parahaliea aestuarii TaxID=1852021 RepID=A0A5C8ZQL9_9GAMM|nr:translesion DNA synthesis-associated protein ImuA [Parahaliea aestuarii]TXS89992.1 translesion DNA synthesis-associated protein ImuA [Parahaliea aestuarii]